MTSILSTSDTNVRFDEYDVVQGKFFIDKEHIKN